MWQQHWHVCTLLQSTDLLCVSPPTALRLLEEFVDLAEGDVVIQNGANSAVGQVRHVALSHGLVCWPSLALHDPTYVNAVQLVIQLAKAKGIYTVNVVRDRPNMAELENYLTGLGADVITTDEKLKAALGWTATLACTSLLSGMLKF